MTLRLGAGHPEQGPQRVAQHPVGARGTVRLGPQDEAFSTTRRRGGLEGVVDQA